MELLEGKAGLVTGGAKGLGRACCDVIGREGGKVVIADLDEENGLEAVRRAMDAGGDARFAKVDVSKSDQVERMVDIESDVELLGKPYSNEQLALAVENALASRVVRPHD